LKPLAEAHLIDDRRAVGASGVARRDDSRVGGPPHFFLEVRILKGLRADFTEVRILKDLAGRPFRSDADFKGVTETKNARGLEVRILKDLEGVRKGFNTESTEGRGTEDTEKTSGHGLNTECTEGTGTEDIEKTRVGTIFRLLPGICRYRASTKRQGAAGTRIIGGVWPVWNRQWQR
jgi:hypothetical protein